MATKSKSKKKSHKNQVREAQVETADEPQIEPARDNESTTAEVSTPTGKSHTLSELAETYIKHMEEVGKSSTTTFAYKMELDGAIAELGEGAKVEEITPEQVKGFFESPRVMKTKAGGSKALPTILKSRRVLRLALDHAVALGWIGAAPIPSKELVALW
jgi:hypothetical protein